MPGPPAQRSHDPLVASFALLTRPGPDCNWDQWRMDIEMYFRAESVWRVCEPEKGDGGGFFSAHPMDDRIKAKALGIIYFSVDEYYQRLVHASKTPAEALRLLKAEVSAKQVRYAEVKQTPYTDEPKQE